MTFFGKIKMALGFSAGSRDTFTYWTRIIESSFNKWEEQKIFQTWLTVNPLSLPTFTGKPTQCFRAIFAHNQEILAYVYFWEMNTSMSSKYVFPLKEFGRTQRERSA